MPAIYPDNCPACGARGLKWLEPDQSVPTDQLVCEACGGMFEARTLKRSEEDPLALEQMKRIERELARVGADGRGGTERMVVEARKHGRCSVSCSTGSLMTAYAEILSKLHALPDGAGFSAVWEALFDFPETPDCFD